MEYKKLKDLVEINSESITKNYNETIINYLDTSNITNGKINSVVEMNIGDAPSRAKRIVRKNDIIYSTVRPNLCHYGILRETLKNMIVSTGFAVLRCKEGILPEYLYEYITLPSITMRLQAIAETSTSAYPSIKPKDLEDLDILLPPIEIQQKIANILSNIDKKIELNSKINDNLQKLINNLYIKYFINFDEYTGEYKKTELGMIPRSFEVDRLGNVITFSNGYGWNSKDMLDEGIEDSYKVFKMGNINIGGGINKSKTKSWIKKEKVEGLEQYISKKGDILMCMTDMKNSGNPLLGHTALIDRDSEFIINQRVGIIRCERKLDYTYIYTMSNLKNFIDDIRSRANSGVQVNLTTKGICDTLILVPDDNTLIKFQQVAKTLYEKIFNNNNENETLEIMRDSLLPKLMNGEIDLDKVEVY